MWKLILIGYLILCMEVKILPLFTFSQHLNSDRSSLIILIQDKKKQRNSSFLCTIYFHFIERVQNLCTHINKVNKRNSKNGICLFKMHICMTTPLARALDLWSRGRWFDSLTRRYFWMTINLGLSALWPFAPRRWLGNHIR